MTDKDKERDWFQDLYEMEKGFIYGKNYYPNCILMHPSDAARYAEYYYSKTGMCEMGNLLTFKNYKIYRTLDIKEGAYFFI